jgi:regulator of cell morphogenesis and NO signaling
MTLRFQGATVGDIVSMDFRTVDVFDRFGIDFCCDGRQSLDEACRDASVDPATVLQALDGLPDSEQADDVLRWPLATLIDHIVQTHHSYVRRALPAIARQLAELEVRFGSRHTEVTQIRQIFDDVAAELTQHLMKEEQVLFPYVRDLEEGDTDVQEATSPFGTVSNPIRMMEHEHMDASKALHQIRALSHRYAAPADGDQGYAKCLADLALFDRDLHRHIALENNVLFPRAIERERALWRN